MTIDLDLLGKLIEQDERAVIPTDKDVLLRMLHQLRRARDAERASSDSARVVVA